MPRHRKTRHTQPADTIPGKRQLYPYLVQSPTTPLQLVSQVPQIPQVEQTGPITRLFDNAPHDYNRLP